MIGSLGARARLVNYCKPPICGTRRALELLHPLPFKLGRIPRIGGSANYPSAGLGVNYSAGRPLTGAEEGVVGSGGEDHGQRERLVAAAATRSLEQGAPQRWPRSALMICGKQPATVPNGWGAVGLPLCYVPMQPGISKEDALGREG